MYPPSIDTKLSRGFVNQSARTVTCIDVVPPLLTTDMTRTTSGESIVIATAHKKGQRFEIDDYTIRFAFAIAPVWAAYSTFWVSKGDPVPRTFTRHASAHAVSTAQYSRTNTVIALMLVTSLLWVLEDQDRRQVARAS